MPDASVTLLAGADGPIHTQHRVPRFGSMVGRSPRLQAALGMLDRAARNDVSVLLEGETGTGKESAAEYLHRMSARAGRPFVVVDCGSIPPALLESELFGHERGSFTGAVAARQGAFELAQGGTIFLDEIDELASELQPKLLRVLERWQVKRVGADGYTPVDVRCVAATSRNLRGEVRGGRFRKDLYYRLAVVEVKLPPLRERLEDLAALIEHILAELGVAAGAGPELLRSPTVRAEMQRHGWPGNVRELRNFVERALTLGIAPPLPDDDEDEAQPPAGDAIDLGRPLKDARADVLRRFETRYLAAMLERWKTVSAAARAAGVDRITFRRLLVRNGLR